MIVFDLLCICGFQFEGWFESRSDFDTQLTGKQIVCPDCSSHNIHKILSPVSVRTGSTNINSNTESPGELPAISDETARQFLRSVQHFVETKFEDVGTKLAKESLKIHYGVAEPRNIRGVTTANEEKMLREEGIELLKIPIVKKCSGPKPN